MEAPSQSDNLISPGTHSSITNDSRQVSSIRKRRLGPNSVDEPGWPDGGNGAMLTARHLPRAAGGRAASARTPVAGRPVVGTRLIRRHQPALSSDGDLQTPESVLLVLGEQQLGHPAVRDGRFGSSRKHEHWNTPFESVRMHAEGAGMQARRRCDRQQGRD